MTCSQSVHGLSNPLEVIVHYLLIGKMVGLDHQDKFPMVSALVYTTTHCTGSIRSHYSRLSISHDFTKLFYCVVSQPLENIELALKLVVALTYGWDRKLIIYFLWIGSLSIEVNSDMYSQ